MTQQLRIAQTKLRSMKHTKCQTIIYPNKSIFEANVYYFEMCDFGPKSEREFKQSFDC